MAKGASSCAGFFSTSKKINLSQAPINASGVLRSPSPYTFLPASRSRVARRVKSLSLETIQNPSTLPAYNRSMASMMNAESVEFFPWVYANCCIGWMACLCRWFFQPTRF
ncbi:hypothetical protein D3C85_798910 [compost metagenome]